MSKIQEVDVLIIGAGPAGASTALFLAKQGISCTIVDKHTFPRDKVCGDALSGKVVEVLNKLDKKLAAELNENSSFLGSWGVTFVAPNGKSLRVPFSTNKDKNAAPGFLSKRMDFDHWLIEKLKSNTFINLEQSTEIRTYTKEANCIHALSKDGKEYQAKIVIAADGSYSTFTKDVAGLKTEPQHNCFGLRAYYKHVKGLDTENFIELHFLKGVLPGYFWIFPLPNGQANVGIGMRADKMTAKKINLKKAFYTAIENTPSLKNRFSDAELLGEVKLHGLPLGSKKRNISGANFMLVGDAALLIDPFTGEGIGNAMMSGMYAAAQAARCMETKDFSADYMKSYDAALYNRLWPELLLSYRMQQLVNFPSLFNFVVNKANSNKMLRETISCMFEDIDMRARLKSPSFYFQLLFS